MIKLYIAVASSENKSTPVIAVTISFKISTTVPGSVPAIAPIAADIKRIVTSTSSSLHLKSFAVPALVSPLSAPEVIWTASLASTATTPIPVEIAAVVNPKNLANFCIAFLTNPATLDPAFDSLKYLIALSNTSVIFAPILLFLIPFFSRADEIKSLAFTAISFTLEIIFEFPAFSATAPALSFTAAPTFLAPVLTVFPTLVLPILDPTVLIVPVAFLAPFTTFAPAFPANSFAVFTPVLIAAGAFFAAFPTALDPFKISFELLIAPSPSFLPPSIL